MKIYLLVLGLMLLVLGLGVCHSLHTESERTGGEIIGPLALLLGPCLLLWGYFS